MYGAEIKNSLGVSVIKMSDGNLCSYLAKVVIDISGYNGNDLQYVGSLSSRYRGYSIVANGGSLGIAGLAGYTDVLILHKPLPNLSIMSGEIDSYNNGKSYGVSVYGNYSLYSSIELYVFGRIRPTDDVDYSYGLNVYNGAGDPVYSSNNRILTVSDSISISIPSRTIFSDYQGIIQSNNIPSVANKACYMSLLRHSNDPFKDGYTVGYAPLLRNNKMDLWAENVQASGSGVGRIFPQQSLYLIYSDNIFDVSPPVTYNVLESSILN